MLDTTHGRGALVLIAALLTSACGLDLTDPNSPNEQDIVTAASGLMEVARGLQAEWGDQVVDAVYIDALVTDGIGAIPQAFESYRLVDAGDPVSNDLGPSTETWSGMYDVVLVADILLDNAPDVPMEPGTRSGLLVLGKLFRGMALGSLLQVYERIPLTVGLDNLDAPFATRDEGLAAVLQLLNEARTQLLATAPSAEFLDDVLEPGLDLANTIDAMIARYSLIGGDLAGAASAAARVDPGVLSEARFSATDGNPLWNMWYNSGNAYRMRPEDHFRVEAEAGDGRVAYWVAEAAVDGSAGALDNFVKYSVREHAWPFYLPDEMPLIRAEVLARQGDLAGALELVNAVRTPCSSALDEPVACLPALAADAVPTQEAMLTQILHEREYELFLQGVRWSDLRRMGVTPKYPFMMVAETECERNPSTPLELCGITR
jgi:peptidoglycan hydrolase-like protein with peptidoglycan-binding domain